MAIALPGFFADDEEHPPRPESNGKSSAGLNDLKTRAENRDENRARSCWCWAENAYKPSDC